MDRQMEQKGAPPGIEKARKRAERQRKYARPLYGLLLKGIRALRTSGDYLEMGAGSGLLAAMVAEDGSATSITAVDISADDITVASEYVRERRLEDRIRCLVGDVYDQNMMRELGKFDLVYSAFSLHHWKDPIKSIGNLWNAVRDNGVLYICDFRRVWWANFLSFRGKGVHSRDSYTPAEIGAILRELGIANYKIKTSFPFFLQSVTAWK